MSMPLKLNVASVFDYWKERSFLATLAVFAVAIIAWDGARQVNAASQASATNQRQLPDENSRKAAERFVENIYADDLRAAKQPEEMVRLANILIDVARKTPDQRAKRFALYGRARKLAVEAADVDVAFLAIEEISRDFDINTLAEKEIALGAIAGNRRWGDNGKTVEGAIRLIADAIGCDQYDVAKRAVALARRRSRSQRQLRAKAGELQKIVTLLAAEFLAIEKARDALKHNPADPTANDLGPGPRASAALSPLFPCPLSVAPALTGELRRELPGGLLQGAVELSEIAELLRLIASPPVR